MLDTCLPKVSLPTVTDDGRQQTTIDSHMEPFKLTYTALALIYIAAESERARGGPVGPRAIRRIVRFVLYTERYDPKNHS